MTHFKKQSIVEQSLGEPLQPYTFKAMWIDDFYDHNPKPIVRTIPEFVEELIRFESSRADYTDYHETKSNSKQLKAAIGEYRASLRADGLKPSDDELYGEMQKELSRQAAFLLKAKNGPAIMPYLYENDNATRPDSNGTLRRHNGNCTHLSLVVLDIEAHTRFDEFKHVFAPYEYFAHATVSHRPDDPRYRVYMFLEEPLQLDVGIELLYRIDAHLPNVLDPSKKTQFIDSASCDENGGRLMFLPKWLKNHPEEFWCDYNQGALLNRHSFKLTEEQKEAVASRRKAKEEAQKAKTAKVASTSSVDWIRDSNQMLIEDSKGRVWLHPNATFDTDDGPVTIKDVVRKIPDVLCPFHNDSSPAEFIDLNKLSGRPQFVCKQCGTFKLIPNVCEQNMTPMESAALRLARFKAKSQ